MIIREVWVRNFRCIRDETLSCGPLTVLVGPNGSGKSAFLRALDIFYTSSANYSEADFYNNDTSTPISITLTFGDLTECERQLFSSHVAGENLTVEKELSWPRGRDSQKYYGFTRQHPVLQPVRKVEGLRAKKDAYRELLESDKCPDDLPKLPTSLSWEEIDQVLIEWEGEHPEALEMMRDDGQFFGYKEVGGTRLRRYTCFLLIPAVLDASEHAEEGRDSAISKLMDLVVRSTLARREDVRKFHEDVQARYKEVMDPSRLAELQQLSGQMTQTLGWFAPGTGIDLGWVQNQDVEIPMPRADVKVIEDEYPSSVERAGHGLQRAFILTALQHLATAEASAVGEEATEERACTDLTLPRLILAIEEPELYQHPSRQRRMAQVFLRLAQEGIEGVAQSVQIIYATHSPLFVDLDHFDNIRLLRKEQGPEGDPQQTRVFQCEMGDVVKRLEEMEEVQRGSFSPDSIRSRLQALMTPWTNEGFFANVVVAVEGEEDRAVILGVASAMGRCLDSIGVAVIPCGGKGNLHKSAAVFGGFQIPVYTVWDWDRGSGGTKLDRRLQKHYKLPDGDYSTRVGREFACFEVTLGATLKEELGAAVYDCLFGDCCKEFGYHGKTLKGARKNPRVVRAIVERAKDQGCQSPTLQQVVVEILRLAGQGAATLEVGGETRPLQ